MKECVTQDYVEARDEVISEALDEGESID